MTATPSLLRFGITDNQTLAGGQAAGAVIPSSDGSYFAVWLDGGLVTVVGRHFDALGNPLSGEVNLTPGFTNNEDVGTLSSVTFLSGARLPISGQADGFAVAFVDEVNNGATPDVWLIRANASLGTITPFPLDQIIASQATPEANPAITSFADGGLVISYTRKDSGGPDPNTVYQTDWDLIVKTVSPSGVVSGTIKIWEGVQDPTLGIYAPSDLSQLATLANGNFVDVFEIAAGDRNTFAGDYDVLFAIETGAGANVVSPRLVAGTGTHFFEGNPHVAALADGFVVTWDGFAVDGVSNGYGVGASVYDANGVLLQGDIVVETMQDSLNLPHNDVAALPDGGFIVSWEDVQTNTNRAQTLPVVPLLPICRVPALIVVPPV